MVLQAFMDESGNWGPNDTDHVFVIAGFISTADKWQDFADDWLASGLPKDLKMALAIKKASTQGKTKYLDLVLGMVERSTLWRVECAVHLDSYRRIAKGKVPSVADNPYFFAFHEAIARIASTVLQNFPDSGPIDLFFDRQEKYGVNGEKWYDLARHNMSPTLRALLPSGIMFKSDEEFLPLKSADLLAGLARRDHNGEVLDLQDAIKRMEAIPCLDSRPLEDDHFQSLVDSGGVEFSDDALAAWRERWSIDGSL